MTLFHETDLIWKKLVEAGFISSNQEAKRLVKDGAILIGPPGGKWKDAHRIKLTDSMKIFKIAAQGRFFIKIGKLVVEQLTVEENNEGDIRA